MTRGRREERATNNALGSARLRERTPGGGVKREKQTPYECRYDTAYEPVNARVYLEYLNRRHNPFGCHRCRVAAVLCVAY